MPDDTPRMEPAGIAQADQLYRGFPDFSEWGKLSPTDADLWSRFATSLEERRREATPETLKAAVEVAVRAAALDTGAIEGLYNVDRGFTMTVAVQGLAWQQMIEERGAGVRELFEAQLAAYELVLDAVTQDKPITEVWIRQLHETLCAPQKTFRVLTDLGWQEQELPKGQYKTRPNHVRLTDGTLHAYAPVDRVPSEMHRLLEQIRTPEFEAAHPVLQASYCHYAFVVIHPFADGNGRVARALASTFFYRAQSIPLVIFENQRPAYLDALRAADQGDVRPVISFFLDRGIDTMQLVSESLMTAGVPKPEELAGQIKNSARRTLSYAEARLVLRRVLSRVNEMFLAQAQTLQLPNLEAKAVISKTSPEHPSAIGALAILELTRANPRKTVRESVFAFCEPRPSPFPINLHARRRNDELEIRLEDANPELTPHLLLRLDQWVRRLMVPMLSEIADETHS